MEFYFAPLEGVTGFTYRNAYNDLFDDMDKYYAPFISPSINDRLKGKEIRDLLPENNNKGINLVPQILANRADYFIKAANQLIELGYDKEINLNAGCPSGTVVSKNKGAGFLKDTEAMDRFFDETFNWLEKKNSEGHNLSISVKTRIGMYEPDEFENILEVYNKYPISQLIVHPRTREQLYKGTPNMEAFKYALENSKNPVCYNGDINTVENYHRIIEKINDDSEMKIGSIMIGRGLIGNPNLVNEIKGGKKLTKKMLEAYHDRLYNDFEKIMKADKHLLFKMKEMWTYMSLNFDDSHKCAKLIRKAQNLYKYNLAVYEIFEKYEVDTIVVGMPLNMNGTMSERAKITEQFVHKLKCKYNKMEIHTIDERLTTVEAHKTMNFLEVNKNKKKNIVDTISAVYILETYLNKLKNTLQNN